MGGEEPRKCVCIQLRFESSTIGQVAVNHVKENEFKKSAESSIANPFFAE